MSFTVKFDPKSLKNVEANVVTAFKKVIANKQMLDEVGQTIVTDVVEQTRNERSIPLGKELRLLKEGWITRKARITSVNQPDPNYEEGKSNLTFTGQLLNSFTWAIESVGVIKLFFKDNHKPYNILGERKKQPAPLANEDLAKYIAESGRPFVGVRPTIKRRINRIVKTYLKRALVVARLSKNNIDS
jgi:hypothetical protein